MLLLLVVFAALALAKSESKFKSLKRLGNNLVHAKLVHESRQYSFDLVRDNGLFAGEAAVLHSQGEHEWRTARTYLARGASPGTWGVGFMDYKEDTFHGVFSIHGEAFYVFPIKLSCGGYGQTMRHLTTDELAAYSSLLLPRDTPPPIATTAAAAVAPNTTAFFPGCYPNDGAAPHKLSISIATDWGFLQRVHKLRGKGAPLGELDKIKNVLLEIEFAVGLTRAVLLAQFNVLVEIQRVVVGGKDSEFLHQAKSAGTCPATVGETHTRFHQWTRESAPESRMWFLLTDCHGDQGAGFVGGAGMSEQNAAVVSHQSGHAWLHFVQQFGHSLGLHRAPFQGNNNNDQGVQFHADNREAVCAHLTNLPPSEYFQLVAAGSGATCGNAVFEPSEECECLEQDKTMCEGCVNCQLADPKMVCASSAAHAFVVRHAQTPLYVAVTKALQSSPECCLDDGQMPPSPQTCNNRLDVCSSITGQCEKACSKYMLRPCGFDQSGCVQQCFYEGRCQGAKLTSQDVPPLPVGMVPNGNACQLPDKGTPGWCTNGVCVGNTTTIVVVAAANEAQMDLERNELHSSWSGGVKATIVVTEKDQEERCPMFADLLSICPEQLTKEACGTSRCTWCGAKAECHPTAHACNLPNQDEIDRWYLPCQPKV